MPAVRILFPLILCAALLLGCQIVPKDQVQSTTLPPTVPATLSEPAPTQAQTSPPITEEIHSSLYIPGLPVEDVVRYFTEVCLSAEFVNSGDPSLLQKWTGPLIYQIHGTPTPEDLLTLEGFASELNQIHGFPGIREAAYPEEATLNIHFCSREDFLALMGDNFFGADGGVTFWYENDEIYNAIICICTDLDQQLRNSVILEELYNGLGPVQDSVLRSDSIIWSEFSQPQELTPVDWLILELLYHPDLQCSWDARQCEATIRALYH